MMQPTKLTRTWDVLVLSVSAILIFCYSYFASRHRIFWSDELFAWLLLTDPSWSHMWRAWNLGADSGGPGFYTLCRIWLGIFGQNEIAYRAFSAAGIFAAFSAMWFTLRRYYRPHIVAFALAVVFSGSPVILWHMVQTRFYGLLLGAAAWCLYTQMRSADETKLSGHTHRTTLALSVVFNVLLVSTHALGLFYSGLLLAGALISDLLARRKRLAYYASVIVTWPVFLFSRTALHSLARVGQPWFWTLKPTRLDLWRAYVPLLFQLVGRRHLAVLLVFALVVMVKRRAYVVTGFRSRSTVLILAIVLLFAPVILWILSQSTTSYFVDRYFLPYALGATILFTELLSDVFAAPQQRLRPYVAVAFTLLSIYAGIFLIQRIVIPYTRDLIYPPHDFTAALEAMVPTNEPIVVPKADIFNMMSHYQNSVSKPVLFPYDWALALDPRSPKWLVSAEREVDNSRLSGYFKGEVIDTEDLLRTTPRFAVITDNSMMWLGLRVEQKPGWRVQKVGELQDGFWSNSVYQVTRTQ